MPAGSRGHENTLPGQSGPASAPRRGDRTGLQCQAHAGGPSPRHRRCSEVTACLQCFTKKLGDIVTLFSPHRRLGACHGGWDLTGMCDKAVPLLTGAGLGGLGAGECCAGMGSGQHPRQSCPVVGRGFAMRLVLSCMASAPWGMLRGRMALTSLHSLCPRTRGCRKTSQTR